MRVTHGGGYFQDASRRLQRDRGVLLEAARTDPTVVEYVRLYMDADDAERDELLSDDAVVRAAVAQWGGMIRYAAHAWRADRTMVMTALTAPHARLASVPPHFAADPCINLCVSGTRPRPLVDALLTVLEAELEELDVERKDAVLYWHKLGRPFTADTVLPLLLQVPSDYRNTAGADRLEALARAVNSASAYSVFDASWHLEAELKFGDSGGVLSDEQVDEVVRNLGEGYKLENMYHTYGVCDNVAERLHRLQQIADALPYIARAVRLGPRDWTGRVEAMAAKVHRPTGAYATLVHKRSFAEAFA